MPIKKGDHPLAFLQAIQKAVSTLEATADKYKDFIKKAPARQIDVTLPAGYYAYTLAFVPTNPELDFYFELRAAKDLQANGADYTTIVRPLSAHNLSEKISGGLLTALNNKFNEWIGIIVGYSSIKLADEEDFTEESAKEFYDYFELLEEDIASVPFDEERQIYLYRLLELIKHKIEQDDNSESTQAKELVKEILLLEMRIPTATKEAAVKGLSKIYAKLKVYSFKIFMDSVDVLKKEAIKAVLYGGMHKVEQAIHQLQQFYHAP